MAVDPICGMTVDEATGLSSTVDGETFWFCNPSCKTRFDEGRGAPHPALRATFSPQSGEKDLYTCPMHPEVVQNGPGACPICGMALEPRVATLESKPNDELIDMQRRFVVSAMLTAPVFVMGMMDVAPWLQFLL